MLKYVRKTSILVLAVCGLLLVTPEESRGQQWLQTSQLIVPIETQSPTRVLLDTLVQVIQRSDTVHVQRTPNSSEELSISELRDQLISGPGLGLTSANNVFIDYRFEIENRGFEQSITSLQFVYRAPGGAEEDIQMLYVDATQPWVRNVLNNKGVSLTTNEAALITFSDQLGFERMVQDGKIVEIAGQTVREGFETKKRKLVQKVQRLTYESM